jgi:hypothetical protein
VVATHAQRMREDQADRLPRAPVARRARDATAGLTVTRLANGTGVVSFAGTDYQAGRAWARQSVDVSIVAGSVQLSRDAKIIRVHPIRHDRAHEWRIARYGRSSSRTTVLGLVLSRRPSATRVLNGL